MRFLLVLLFAVAPVVADDPHPLTAEDLWSMERVADPRPSPDGRHVAFTVTAFDAEENKGNSDLWLVSADGGGPRRLTWNDGADSSPRWSPDGRFLLFTSKRGEGPSQLYLLPMAGGEAEPLTDLPIGPSAARWFPDGKRIAFLGSTWPDLNDDWEKVEERVKERKDDKTAAKITETRLLRYWDHYLDDERASHLFVLDLETREVTDLMPGSTRLLPFWSSSGTFDISPDGEEIAFSANASERPWRTLNFDLWLMPAAGGEAVNITAANPAQDGSPRYSPDGRHIIYSRNKRPEVAPDFSKPALYDRSAKRHRDFADGWDGQPGGFVFSADGKRVFFHDTVAGRRNLYTAGIADGRVELLAKGGSTRGVQIAGDALFYTLESFGGPAEVMTLATGGGEPRALTAFNDERLAALDLGSFESATFKGARGEEVQMFVLYPPGFDPGKKWPLLHVVHGGPHGSWTDSFHFRWNAPLFSSPGYVVAAVNFHGSTGFGQQFAESILGAHGDLPFTDIMKATDALLARGFIDETRMAAAGGSYGGYLVSWILGHTDRFAALVNHAGVYDLMAQFASDYTWGRPNNYGAGPWEDPGRIDRWSPSRFAENFSTPTLILHGEKDYRVPYTQGLNLHGVLTGKGVPSRIVVFPGENHWILKPQSAAIWWEEVFGWLARYLGDPAAGAGE